MTNRPTVFLIDDLRDFREYRSTLLARTSAQALAILEEVKSFDEVWLDHDLGKLEDGTTDSIMPVIDFFAEKAFLEEPYEVGVFYIHTSNPVGSKQMVMSLRNYGYKAIEVYAPTYLTVHKSPNQLPDFTD